MSFRIFFSLFIVYGHKCVNWNIWLHIYANLRIHCFLSVLCLMCPIVGQLCASRTRNLSKASETWIVCTTFVSCVSSVTLNGWPACICKDYMEHLLIHSIINFQLYLFIYFFKVLFTIAFSLVWYLFLILMHISCQWLAPTRPFKTLKRTSLVI